MPGTDKRRRCSSVEASTIPDSTCRRQFRRPGRSPSQPPRPGVLDAPRPTSAQPGGGLSCPPRTFRAPGGRLRRRAAQLEPPRSGPPCSFRAPGAQLRRRRERDAHPGPAGPSSGVEACVRRTRSTSGRSVARRPADVVQPTHGTGKLILRNSWPAIEMCTGCTRSRRCRRGRSGRSAGCPWPRPGWRSDRPAPRRPAAALATTRRSDRPALAGSWRTRGRGPARPARDSPFRPAGTSKRLADLRPEAPRWQYRA